MMVVFSLFVGLIVDRLKIVPRYWQINDRVREIFHTMQQLGPWKPRSEEATELGEQQVWYQQGALIGPLVLVVLGAFLLSGLLSGLLTLLVNILVLVLAFHCQKQRYALKKWYRAKNNLDLEEMREQEELLKADCPQESLGQRLLWLNFSYYFAVIFWFVLLGFPGVIIYVFLRANRKYYSEALHYAYWVPSRVITLIYAFVGHFSQAVPVWANSAWSSLDAKAFLLEVAQATEGNPVSDDPTSMLALARRTSIFLLVVVAIYTLLV